LTEHGHQIREYDVAYFMASVDTLADNTGFAKKESADFPILSDSTKATAQKYGVLSDRGFANRWTFYIGRDGRILYIDKAVKAGSAGQDVAAKLAELGIERARSH
jgi:thioredoxin-dependent peroxiredoxin